MGIGVGRVGYPNGGGTIGGYLRETSKPYRVFAVTAHHVVSQQTGAISSNDEVRVQSPALCDLRWKKERIDTASGKLALRIEGLVAEEMMGIQAGARPSSKLSTLRAEKDAIDKQGQDLDAHMARDNSVGTVYALSGLRTAKWNKSDPCDSPENKLHMDWALVELDDPRWAANSSRLFITNGALDGTDVQKVGRITSHTLGETLGRSTVTLPGVPKTLEMRAVKKLGTGDPSFAERGDSGAWILDMKGEVLGMIFAGDPMRHTAYYTPLDMMLEDMKEHTGLELEVMPRRSTDGGSEKGRFSFFFTFLSSLWWVITGRTYYRAANMGRRNDGT